MTKSTAILKWTAWNPDQHWQARMPALFAHEWDKNLNLYLVSYKMLNFR